MLLEDIDLVPLYCVQVVIQRQQNQEGPKHGNGGQEVPDIVVIKEVEEDAVAVVLPGLCGGFLPRAQSLEEEEEREAPDHGGADDAEQRDELDPLAAPELHDDVEGEIKQQVADANCQQEIGRAHV